LVLGVPAIALNRRRQRLGPSPKSNAVLAAAEHGQTGTKTPGSKDCDGNAHARESITAIGLVGPLSQGKLTPAGRVAILQPPSMPC
jgi:hypothetical protein